MRLLFRALLSALLCTGLPYGAYAQQSEVVGPAPFAHPAQLEAKWREVGDALEQGNLPQASDRLQELNKLKFDTGYESMESFSLSLLNRGYEALSAGKFESAAFFERQAFELSPHSPRVQIKAAWLSRKLGTSVAVSRLFKALVDSWNRPELCVLLMSIVPGRLLWSVTLAVYAVLLIYLVVHMQEILRGIMAYLPPRSRALSGPMATAAVLLVPLYYGPLCTLLVWSLLASFVVQQRKLFVVLCGALLMGWGLYLPLRDQLNRLHSDSQAKVLLSELGGDFRLDALREEGWRTLHRENVSSDVLSLALGVALLRRGEYASAKEVIAQAEILGGQTAVSRGLLALLAVGRGDFKGAQTHFVEAETLGAKSADFYFDFSKVKFALMDTGESKLLLQRAIAVNAPRAKELQERENLTSSGGIRGYAIIRPSLPELTRALYRNLGTVKTEDSAPGAGASAQAWVGLLWLAAGAILLALSFRPFKAVRRNRGQVYYARFKMPRTVSNAIRWIPGAGWIMQGYESSALILLTLVALAILPLTAVDQGLFATEGLLNFFNLYCLLALLFVFGLASLSYLVGEEK